MKAWRKHNQKLTTRIQQLEEDLSFENFFIAHTADTTKLDRTNRQLRMARGFYLRTKTERRTQYAAEVATPSYLLLALFKRVGLWTPT